MCGGGCCPDPVFVPDPQSFLNTISACGNWCVPCSRTPLLGGNSTENEIWNSTKTVSGTVTVNYQGGCDDSITVIAYRGNVRVGSFTVDRAPAGDCRELKTGNTASQLFENFDRLVIVCETRIPTGNCFGKYCLDLYHIVTAP